VRDRLPALRAPASALLGEMRLRKSAAELDAIARTGELVSRGVDLAQQIAEPA
jgi:Xaa-Pro aminopeptidase